MEDRGVARVYFIDWLRILAVLLLAAADALAPQAAEPPAAGTVAAQGPDQP
jgi:hypothetical protein